MRSDLAKGVIEEGYIPELRGYTEMRRKVKYGEAGWTSSCPGKEMLLE